MARHMLQVSEHKEGRDTYAFASEFGQRLEKFKLNSSDGNKGSNVKYTNPVHYHRHKEAFPDDEIRTKRQGQLERQLNQYTHRVTEARNKHFNRGQRVSHNSHGLVFQPNHYHGAPGSGMRAVFLGGSEPRSGSGGTGVFLPRGSGNALESRKKSGCSTVLIPARVAQALELHFERVSSQSRIDEDELTGVKGDVNSHQTKTHEICLPEEWTY